MKELTTEQLARRLSFDNPWWAGGDIDVDTLSWPHRDYYEPFEALALDVGVRRAVLLMGPRRVGKTVMMHQLVHALLDRGVPGAQILFASLDTPTYLDLSLEDMVQLFFDRHGHDRSTRVYVLFDEVQYREDWEIHLKSLVDSYPRARFVASGSAAAALKLKSRESGAGRFTEFVLPPLTFREYLRFVGAPGLPVDISTTNFSSEHIAPLNAVFVEYINFGAFPEVALSPGIRRDPERYIRNDIIDKVLLRDLPSLYGIHDVQELYRLFVTLAYNSGAEVSLDGLSQRSGVSKITLRRYLEYLEAAFLIRVLHRVGDHGARFQRETAFKVYLTNPAMRAALFGALSAEDEAMGLMVETALVSQIAHAPEGQGPFAYARWKEGREDREVDLVFTSTLTGPWAAFEVKWSDRQIHRMEELRGLLSFAQKNHGLRMVEVTTRAGVAEREVGGVRVRFMPSALWCLDFGSAFSALRGWGAAMAGTPRLDPSTT